VLAGGGGRDTFTYFGASESTGATYDTLGDFDAGSDKIDLLGTVTGFHAPVEGGTLSLATFDADLSAALSGLGASQAAWFAPDAGDLAGQIFLIVDANGVAGYQEGEDYVFAVSGTPLVDLSGHTDIFV
jgi:peptidase M10/serralysin-like protein